MRGFVKGVRLRRTPSLPPLHLVPIRILSRRRGVGCLLKSVFGLPLMPRTHLSESMHAVTGTGCKLTLDWRSSSTLAASANLNPSLYFRSFLLSFIEISSVVLAQSLCSPCSYPHSESMTSHRMPAVIRLPGCHLVYELEVQNARRNHRGRGVS